jgi:hypothetical protein
VIGAAIDDFIFGSHVFLLGDFLGADETYEVLLKGVMPT